jgi:hypothetical protein
MFKDEFDNHEDSTAAVWQTWDGGDFDPWPAGPETGWRLCELPAARVASGSLSDLRTKGVAWPFSTPRRCSCDAVCRERANDGS